jgi:hypothetical protein
VEQGSVEEPRGTGFFRVRLLAALHWGQGQSGLKGQHGLEILIAEPIHELNG